MKKLFFFAMLAAGMTAACQKPAVEVVDSDEPVAIQFGVKAPTLTVTKTKAAIDDWSAESVTIYGYQKNNVSNLQFNGIKGTVTNTTDNNAEAADVSSITFTDTPYYDATLVYDFRATYTGDADVQPATTDASITQVITFDGDDDIMHAKTNPTEDSANPTLNTGETLNTDRVYSAYAARRNVHPSLVFDHKLTRFAFFVTKGNSNESAKPVKVTGITVKSKNTGTLYIAGTDEGKFDPTGEATDLTVKGISTPITPDSSTPAGEIMVFPVEGTDNSIDITLQLSADGVTSVAPMTVKLKPSMIPSNTSFAAGTKYNITFTVYGLEEVSVKAELTEWKDGGDVTYDPDQYWEAE